MKVIITLEDGANQEETAKQLAEAGLTTAKVLDILHLITGVVAQDKIGALRAVRGVQAVTESVPFSI